MGIADGKGKPLLLAPGAVVDFKLNRQLGSWLPLHPLGISRKYREPVIPVTNETISVGRGGGFLMSFSQQMAVGLGRAKHVQHAIAL
jgi:hypothetical protein